MSVRGFWIALWSVMGVEVMLVDALYRLWPRAIAPLSEPSALPLEVWLTYCGSILFLGFFEGYRGFQRAFSPRVAARALWLAAHPTPLRVLLGPFFVMGLFGATPHRLWRSWLLVLGLVAIIVLVAQLSPLYRAGVDAGVVVGLSWGALATAASFVRALQRGPLVDPEVG